MSQSREFNPMRDFIPPPGNHNGAQRIVGTPAGMVMTSDHASYHRAHTDAEMAASNSLAIVGGLAIRQRDNWAFWRALQVSCR